MADEILNEVRVEPLVLEGIGEMTPSYRPNHKGEIGFDDYWSASSDAVGDADVVD